MWTKKLCLALILMGLMAIPFSGRTDSGKNFAPGQEKKVPPNPFVGDWLCKNVRLNTTTGFRPVNYIFNADGTITITAATVINSINPASKLLNSGFTSRLPAQGHWEMTADNTAHFHTVALYLN